MCTGAVTAHERIALEPVDVLTTDAQRVRAARPGERFMVREGSILASTRDEYWTLDDERIIPRHPGLVDAPPASVRRYVRAEGAGRYELEGSQWRRTAALRGGDAIDVADHLWDGKRALLRDGLVVGWVDDRELSSEPVAIDALFAQAKARFVDNDLIEARALASEVRRRQPDHVSATRMEAAISIQNKELYGQGLYETVKPPPMPVVAPEVPPVDGAPAFVVHGPVSPLAARGDEASAMPPWPPSLRVDVLERAEGWARCEPGTVAPHERALIDLGRLGDHPAGIVNKLPLSSTMSAARTVKASARAGWVPLAALDGRAPDVSALEARAAAAASAGEHERAALLFERHYRLTRKDASRQRARRAAIAAERWLEALRLRELGDLPRVAAQEVTPELLRFAGCRGDRRYASAIALDDVALPPLYFTGEVWAHMGLNAFKEPAPNAPRVSWPADACVGRLIEPVDCSAPQPATVDDELTSETRADTHATEGPPSMDDTVREVERHEAAFNRRKAKEVARRVEVSLKARRQAFDELLAREIPAAGQRHWARLRLSNPDDVPRAGSTLVLFEGTFAPDVDCQGTDAGYRDVADHLWDGKRALLRDGLVVGGIDDRELSSEPVAIDALRQDVVEHLGPKRCRGQGPRRA